ncbi:Dabb family protein [Microbacterium indicum]|uniref:Dabb family protein n=1 Tax=Microbacterium indicum TaxID=358100 RepID=UPI0003F7EEA1|nr:Dabb family protein [Microbacterium indicum]
MIRHIVLFGAAEGTTREALDETAGALEALVGKVPGLLSMKAGADLGIDGNAALGLVAEFEDRAALDVYATHPAHLEVVALVARFKTSRAAIDIEV